MKMLFKIEEYLPEMEQVVIRYCRKNSPKPITEYPAKAVSTHNYDVSFDSQNLVEYKKISIKDAARIVIHEKIAVLGGSGGVIAIDSKGNVAMEMNTKGMYRAHMDSKGNFSVKIYSDD